MKLKGILSVLRPIIIFPKQIFLLHRTINPFPHLKCKQ